MIHADLKDVHKELIKQAFVGRVMWNMATKPVKTLGIGAGAAFQGGDAVTRGRTLRSATAMGEAEGIRASAPQTETM